MAAFYNQGDQEIYESGNKFVPQEQYRLGPFTPPAIMGQNTSPNINTGGITAALPLWQQQGFNSYEAWLAAQQGGGRDDPVTDPNRGGINFNLGPANITDYEADAYGVGPTFQGSIARLQDLYSQLPTPGNLIRKGIRHWQGKRAEKKAAADKIAEQKAAAEASGANVGHYDPQAGGASHLTRGRDQGGLGLTQSQAQSVSDANKDAGYSSWGGLAEGGRAGYRTAGPVLGDDEGSENIFEFMQDQGIPGGEMVEEEPTEEEKAMVIDMNSRGNDTDTISTITGLTINTINKILGIELAQGGIARLL